MHFLRNVAVAAAARVVAVERVGRRGARRGRVARARVVTGTRRVAAGGGTRARARVGDVARATTARREGCVGLAAATLGNELLLQSVLLRLVEAVTLGVTRRRANVACATAAGVGGL